jgi:hypothetical protein
MEKPPWGAEPRIEPGQALQLADALPSELRRTLLRYVAPFHSLYMSLSRSTHLIFPVAVTVPLSPNKKKITNLFLKLRYIR